jgi:hypothetical protein
LINRREFVKTTAITALAATIPSLAETENVPHAGYEVGAYYFPNWHVDPLNEETHGRGWTEWELLKRAEPKYPGHQQPKVPQWGYEDESDPVVFAKKIDAAAGSGLSYFIYDWYWYRGKPFLNRALEQGHLAAANRQKLKFCLMWANHDWVNLFPARLHMPFQMQYPGSVDQAQLDIVTSYIAEHYFSSPEYWQVNGAPYFSIYDLANFIKGLGGIDGARTALDAFRKKTMAIGFSGLHVNVIDFGIRGFLGNNDPQATHDLVSKLGLDSVTSYCWVHNAKLNNFPTTNYADVARQSEQYWKQAAQQFGVPYYPNVSMGWDSSPRTCQSDVFTNAGYPFVSVVTGNSPAAFRDAMLRAKASADLQPGATKIFNINAWNEWTEGSYLEPDTVHGMAYLNAVRDALRS